MNSPSRETLRHPSRALEIVPGRAAAPVVIVLGPDPSGTTLCSSVLRVLGIDMSDFAAVEGTEPPERDDIAILHDRILALLNRPYDSPLHDLSLPPVWWTAPAMRSIKDELLSTLRERIGPVPFGFGDPLTSRLLPIWRQIFRELNLNYKIVLCLPNPGPDAPSLTPRDRVRHERGEFRWFVYWTEIFYQVKKADFCVIQYEDWSRDLAINVEKLFRFLDIDTEQDGDYMREAIADIVADQHSPDDPAYANARQPLVRSLYQAARSFDVDATARETVGRIADHFISYRQLNRHLEREFERVSGLASMLADATNDSAEQTITLPTELAAALAEAKYQGEQRAQLIEKLRGELSDREAALAHAARHAEEQHAAFLHVKGELSGREAALAQAARHAEEQHAAFLSVKGELSGREAALAQAARHAEEQHAAFLSVKGELSGREAALADAARRAEEQHAAFLSVQRELAARDQALIAALRQVDEEAGRVEKLQGEVAHTRAETRRNLEYAQTTLSRREATLAEVTRRSEEALRAARADLSAALEVAARIAVAALGGVVPAPPAPRRTPWRRLLASAPRRTAE